MTNLPPELVQVQRLLRDLAPRRGSRERIYWRIMAKPKRPSLTGTRWALVAACLMVSASAMGLGLRWVAQQRPSQPAEIAATGERQNDVRAPQRQKIKTATAPELDLSSSADHGPAADPARESASLPFLAPRATEALHAVSTAVSACARPDTPVPSPVPTETARLDSVAVLPDVSEPSPPAQAAVAPSELSEQVAEYATSVASMRSNPGAALERLRAHRQRWPRSAIVHEVDLRIIEALVALGRRGEAVTAARAFLQRYPGSAFRSEARHIVEEGSVQ